MTTPLHRYTSKARWLSALLAFGLAAPVVAQPSKKAKQPEVEAQKAQASGEVTTFKRASEKKDDKLDPKTGKKDDKSAKKEFKKGPA
jgi:Ni/Co efflux regulator RcnB